MDSTADTLGLPVSRPLALANKRPKDHLMRREFSMIRRMQPVGHRWRGGVGYSTGRTSGSRYF